MLRFFFANNFSGIVVKSEGIGPGNGSFLFLPLPPAPVRRRCEKISSSLSYSSSSFPGKEKFFVGRKRKEQRGGRLFALQRRESPMMNLSKKRNWVKTRESYLLTDESSTLSNLVLAGQGVLGASASLPPPPWGNGPPSPSRLPCSPLRSISSSRAKSLTHRPSPPSLLFAGERGCDLFRPPSPSFRREWIQHFRAEDASQQLLFRPPSPARLVLVRAPQMMLLLSRREGERRERQGAISQLFFTLRSVLYLPFPASFSSCVSSPVNRSQIWKSGGGREVL